MIKKILFSIIALTLIACGPATKISNTPAVEKISVHPNWKLMNGPGWSFFAPPNLSEMKVQNDCCGGALLSFINPHIELNLRAPENGISSIVFLHEATKYNLNSYANEFIIDMLVDSRNQLFNSKMGHMGKRDAALLIFNINETAFLYTFIAVKDNVAYSLGCAVPVIITMFDPHSSSVCFEIARSFKFEQ